jgi:diguanylate cyclase (GGDEF)-like protein
VRVYGDSSSDQTTKCSANCPEDFEEDSERLAAHLGDIDYRLMISPKTYIDDDDHRVTSSEFAQAVVPLMHQEQAVGFLLILSDNPSRIWADNEVLLLHTVADQLTVAVNQARLFTEMEQLALTDGLTGCYNRRWFDLQLERDLHLATRMRHSVSLVMIDLDNFKRINDQAGHETGDIALRMLATALRNELRAVDTAVRFGGDEFAVILPQATIEGGLLVAKRLRNRIEQIEVPGYEGMTASFGVATFPQHATNRDNLIIAADRALYNSKNIGRNCVSTPPDEILSDSPVAALSFAD